MCDLLLLKPAVVVQSLSHVSLCHPMDCSTPGFPVLHYFLEFAQAHVLHQWCPSTISSSFVPFSSSLHSSPSSGYFTMNQLVSASSSVFPVTIQDWFPLWLTGLISLLFKGLSWVFSNTTVQRCQFLSSQPSLWSNSHIHIWLLEKP